MQTSADAARSGRESGQTVSFVKLAHNSLRVLGLLSLSDSFKILVVSAGGR